MIPRSGSADIFPVGKLIRRGCCRRRFQTLSAPVTFSHFVVGLMRESLDLAEIIGVFKSPLG